MPLKRTDEITCLNSSSARLRLRICDAHANSATQLASFHRIMRPAMPATSVMSAIQLAGSSSSFDANVCVTTRSATRGSPDTLGGIVLLLLASSLLAPRSPTCAV